MRNKPASALRRRRTLLAKKLFALAPRILRGSLLERYKRCGKPGCKCADGPGHGPKYYLSITYPGRRPEHDYLPQAYHEQVSLYLQNLRAVREFLEEICSINRELLRRREKL